MQFHVSKLHIHGCFRKFELNFFSAQKRIEHSIFGGYLQFEETSHSSKYGPIKHLGSSIFYVCQKVLNQKYKILAMNFTKDALL